MSIRERMAEDVAHSATRHESFLVFDRFRYLKIAAALAVAALVVYIAYVPYGTRYGGTWPGYILGTIGALLILWLTWFGYRKRTYNVLSGRLAARLSAHVYLGLALLVVATLHTGFHFDWNIHTFAYVLMCVVIFSGIFGIYIYANFPRLMTENRGSVGMPEMVSGVVSLNDRLRREAQPLDDNVTRLVRAAVEETQLSGGVWRQLSGNYPHCTTAAAIVGMDAAQATLLPENEPVWREVRILLERKATLLRQIRRDLRYKAYMDIWLYFHVPFTFALLAALLAHIVLVIFFLPVLPRV
jgi:hypothetical protein